MASANWRGTVGVVKPTYESGSLVEFIRLLPEGVGSDSRLRRHQTAHRGAVILTRWRPTTSASPNLPPSESTSLHPEGGPPFMVRGYKSEQEIVGRVGREIQTCPSLPQA